ncbi:hypothetical protein PV379_01865 [Streptomyces caniscabiei]|uniref:hypothetical protein n=1 Tax=Streptomyces caniscabiei TaxID=2746961 RepID=UPI0029AA5AB2|nr:hypothetical protein [Streptomyces caniscabiei]MDX2776100.1 hypothetical protein [Streptomyces caniscabiei]
MHETPRTILTPEQSADVIRYYHTGMNHERREKGHAHALALGYAALCTTLPNHSVLPDAKPALNVQEIKEGLEYIKNPPKSDEYYDRLDQIVDRQNVSYDDARRIVALEGVA